MNIKELEKTLLAEARKYESLEDFNAALGWDDWMEEYLETQGYPTEDGEELTEVQANILSDFIGKVWKRKANEDYVAEYSATKYKHVHVKVPNYKADVIAKLNAVENKNDYIVSLIEADIEREKEDAEILADILLPKKGSGRMRNERILYGYTPSAVKCALAGKDIDYLRGKNADLKSFWLNLFNGAIEDLKAGNKLNGKADKNTVEYWQRQIELLDNYKWY